MAVTRGVDKAMGADRPDKQTIRNLWLNEVVSASCAAETEEVPLYLTLPGALGKDIELLVDAGVVTLAENRAIAASDEWKVVAVESSSSAVLELKKRFSGLRVLNQNIQGILHSTGPLTWPRGDHVRYCRAHVVNLDLNASLQAERDDLGHYVFPTIQLIAKLARLHVEPPALDWVLCLTVAAQINWEDDVCDQVQQFLRENFETEPRFAEGSRAVLGSELFDKLCGRDRVRFRELSAPQQQALLMVFVPKKIVHETVNLGWKVTTARNLRYGGQRRSAPMVTWVMQFEQDPRIGAQPRAVYSESLGLALAGAGSIAANGKLRER